MRKPSISQRFRYWFDGVMARGTGALVGLLGLATAVLVTVVAAVLLLANIGPDEDGDSQSAPETLWQSLMRAVDAGTVAGDSGWWYRGLMLVVTIGGIFVVASLISIISGAFDAKVEQLRKGRSTVLEHGHTVILGWNSKVERIVSELALANESEKDAAVVILADKDKVEMEDEIRDAVPNTWGMKVICRTGDPMDQDDLLIANPFEAKSIIVLGDEEADDPDARAIKTTLALTGHPERGDDTLHIVGQIRVHENVEVARLVGNNETSWILAHEKIGQITAQTARQPGLSEVYLELLDFDGDEMYFTQQLQLVGRPYLEAQFAFVDCAVVGIVRDGTVWLNPPPTEEIGPDDQIIVIAEDDSVVRVAEPGQPDEAAVQTKKSPKPQPEKTLVIGFNARVPDLLAEFDTYVPRGSQVTIMSAVPVEGIGRLPHSAVSVIEGDAARRSELDAVEPAEFDHIVIVAYRDAMGVQDADAKTLVTLLHLREILDGVEGAPNIVSEMLDDRNRKLADSTIADDFIVSDNVISLMMAQVSENALLADVFDSLFGSDGAEVYLRPAEWYVKPGEDVDFYTVLLGAARRGETAIGYRIVSRDGGQAEVLVNPHKAGRLAFHPGDAVVVLAEN